MEHATGGNANRRHAIDAARQFQYGHSCDRIREGMPNCFFRRGHRVRRPEPNNRISIHVTRDAARRLDKLEHRGEVSPQHVDEVHRRDRGRNARKPGDVEYRRHFVRFRVIGHFLG